MYAPPDYCRRKPRRQSRKHAEGHTIICATSAQPLNKTTIARPTLCDKDKSCIGLLATMSCAVHCRPNHRPAERPSNDSQHSAPTLGSANLPISVPPSSSGRAGKPKTWTCNLGQTGYRPEPREPAHKRSLTRQTNRTQPNGRRSPCARGIARARAQP